MIYPHGEVKGGHLCLTLASFFFFPSGALNILAPPLVISGPVWYSAFPPTSSGNPGGLGYFLQKMNFHFLTYFSGSTALMRIRYFIQSLGVAGLVKCPLEGNRPQFPAPFQATTDLTIVKSRLCPLLHKQHILVTLGHLESCSPFGGWEEGEIDSLRAGIVVFCSLVYPKSLVQCLEHIGAT